MRPRIMFGVFLVAVLVASCGRAEPTSPEASSVSATMSSTGASGTGVGTITTPTNSSPQLPGEVPGMGLTPDEFWRDQVISYWENWRRGVAVQDCMAEAGFDWEPEVLHAENEVVELARHLNVAIVPEPGHAVPIETINSRRYSTLVGAQRDAYAQALVGESAADWEQANETGVLPENADPATFATEGCKGQAWAAVGSVWDIRSSVLVEWDEVRQELRDTDSFRTAIEPYTRCYAERGVPGVDGPWAVDEMYPDAPGVTTAMQVCDPLWDQADQSAMTAEWPAFALEHRVEIEQQQENYGQALVAITEDQDFLVFLAVRAGHSQALLDQDAG